MPRTDESADRVTVLCPTTEQLQAELENLYASWPQLREVTVDCCSGCATDLVAHLYGWGPATAAWNRVEQIRYLLADD